MTMLQEEIDIFVRGSERPGCVPSSQVTKSALTLFQSLPSARDAVLEYLSDLLDDAVNTHVRNIDRSNNDGSDDKINEMLENVEEALLLCIHSNPDAWSPFISAWSIEVLGEISSKYASKRAVPRSSHINELLQFWMNCKPTKTLIDVTSECFSSVVGGSPDTCVDALLEASVKHSPHFDWVVAHIGSCFPMTVITRVFMCGLKDYYLHGKAASQVHSSTEENIPKLASVVSILGHLANQHSQDIRKALLALFQESIENSASGDGMMSQTVPYLLHLASMSPLLLHVMASDFNHAVNMSVLNSVASQLSQCPDDMSTLVNMSIQLLINCSTKTLSILQFLLDVADPGRMSTVSEGVQKAAEAVVISLLAELQRLAHRTSSGQMTIFFLKSLAGHTDALVAQLLASRSKKQHWLCRILASIAIYTGESSAVHILSSLLTKNMNKQQLGLYLELQEELQMKYADILPHILKYLLSSQPDHTDTERPLANLLQLVKANSDEQLTLAFKNSVIDGLETHLDILLQQLCHPQLSVCNTCMEILASLPLTHTLNMTTMKHISYSLVSYLFKLLHSKVVIEKCHWWEMCRDVMCNLSQSPPARSLIQRLLLASALKPENAVLLGSSPVLCVSQLTTTSDPASESVMEQNKSLSLGMHVPTGHTGIVGHGLRPSLTAQHVSKEEQSYNTQLFMDILYACSFRRDEESSTGTARNIAVMLLDLVLPDKMYNSIAWPEEEFNKFTMERDLVIQKKVKDNPVLWNIMRMIASADRIAACYCGIIQRSVLACLLTYWDSCRDCSTKGSPWHLNTSQQIIACLRQGSLLPPPMCHLDEVLPTIAPFEAHILLQTVWNYMSEHNRDPKAVADRKVITVDKHHTSLLRSILHSNIHSLAPVYARFFVESPTLWQQTG